VISLLLLAISVAAGFLGALLGLGGGIILVPVLTLALGVDIRYAIAASLVSVVATSSGAAASFLRDNLTNIRLAVILEVGTVAGAVVGFLLSGLANERFLHLLFGGVLAFSAVMMLRRRHDASTHNDHPWSARLGLASSYPSPDGTLLAYKVANVPFGLATMGVAGALSALLGIGSGIFKVLAMDGAMKLPMKVSSATSNFMIGVTASASSGAYLVRGDVRPEIAAPVALGVIAGSWLGARAMVRIPARALRLVFVVVLLVVAARMITEGLS
jgi:uncharacterized membrane protein YfcA